jgi:hypothetical protein
VPPAAGFRVSREACSRHCSGVRRLPLPERPDKDVYADPAGHPFCLGIGCEGWPWGPAQVADYERWLAQLGTA